MDIIQILTTRYPGTQWAIYGNKYSGLKWLDDSPKPTKAELEEAWPEVQAEIAAEQQARVDAKASAIAKLEALGLSVEEIKEAFGLEA